MDKNNEREVLATTKEAEPAQVVRTLDDIASELEDAAIPYEGDFADTVRDCAEELRALATAPAPSVKQEAKRDFEFLSRLLPEEFMWGDELLAATLSEILDAYDAKIAAPSASQGEMKVPEGKAAADADGQKGEKS